MGVVHTPKLWLFQNGENDENYRWSWIVSHHFQTNCCPWPQEEKALGQQCMVQSADWSLVAEAIRIDCCWLIIIGKNMD